MSAPPPLVSFTDIAVNATDGMFSGTYNGRIGLHPPDFQTSVISRAAAAGVKRIMFTGTDLAESRAALDMAIKINAGQSGVRCYTTVGLHPTSSARELAAEEERGDGGAAGALLRYEANLLALAHEGVAAGIVVAIGECGLDYDRLQYAPIATQESAFPMHVRLARATSLPLFLHDRNTSGKLLETLHREGGAPFGGVIHSFTGTKTDVSAILATGLYIGINGCAMKTLEGLSAAVLVPLNRLLLETDAPWCSIKAASLAASHVLTTWKVAKKEKWQEDATVKDRSEPCHVVNVAEAFAGVSGIAFSDIARATEENVNALFFPIRKL